MRYRNVAARPLAPAMFGLAMLSGCVTTGASRPAVTTEVVPDKSWQGVILPADAARLAAFSAAWTPALAAARPRFATTLGNEGPLLDPTTALDHVALPPGSYRCRVVKLGGARRVPAYRTYPPFFCYVRGEGANLSFTKQTGDERPDGWLYPDGDRRYVFLGSYSRGRITPPAYGTPGARNALGVIERVAPFRWRLALAAMDDSALLTVYELTPVPLEQQAK